MSYREAAKADCTAPLTCSVLKTMLCATADWILVLDKEGCINEIDFSSSAATPVGIEQFKGLAWIETVTIESREKLLRLLAEATSSNTSAWCEVTHNLPDGTQLAVRYKCILIEGAKVFAVAQNLDEVSALQQQLILQQQAMESDFARLSHMQTRYQLLFDMSTEALLCVNTDKRKIIQANPTAQRLLGKYIAPLQDSNFANGFDQPSQLALDQLLQRAQQSGRADDVAVMCKDGNNAFLASACLMRDRTESVYIIRLAPIVKNVEEQDKMKSEDPLKEMVGQVPLKEMVRESTELIEKLCIEAALEKTSDNRTSAAEMLGVSRQGLYAKLRRFGINDASLHD